VLDSPNSSFKQKGAGIGVFAITVQGSGFAHPNLSNYDCDFDARICTRISSFDQACSNGNNPCFRPDAVGCGGMLVTIFEGLRALAYLAVILER
jgi:hypothetical protein